MLSICTVGAASLAFVVTNWGAPSPEALTSLIIAITGLVAAITALAKVVSHQPQIDEVKANGSGNGADKHVDIPK